MQHRIVTKFFNISDPDFNPDNGENYVIDFYRYMISEGILTGSPVPAEEFLPTLRSLRQTFIDNDKMINQLSEFTDDRSLTWIGIFVNEEAYSEYKQILLDRFGTDFHLTFKTDKISLTTD
jgi:hypothetical protein